MRFTAENKGEAVDRVIAVVHKHLDIVEYSLPARYCASSMARSRGLTFLMIRVVDPFLNGLEHACFATSVTMTPRIEQSSL